MNRLGYPCMNRSLGLTTSTSFRLKSFSEQRIKESVQSNIDHLFKILKWNVKNHFMFFRIGSQFVPFASHQIMSSLTEAKVKFEWWTHFKEKFVELGRFVEDKKIRISMHPDQFVLINSPKPDITARSIAELEYHCLFLDTMGLDHTHKIQIHVGGVYGDKPAAISRFIEAYKNLPQTIKNRLVIENDDNLFSLQDCLEINEKTGIPILFDNFHHECLNNGESLSSAMKSAFATWKDKDGVPMVDYSSQQPGARKGKHRDSVDLKHFRNYLKETQEVGAFDIMLEIKDKDHSALKVRELLKPLNRLLKAVKTNDEEESEEDAAPKEDEAQTNSEEDNDGEEQEQKVQKRKSTKTASKKEPKKRTQTLTQTPKSKKRVSTNKRKESLEEDTGSGNEDTDSKGDSGNKTESSAAEIEGDTEELPLSLRRPKRSEASRKRKNTEPDPFPKRSKRS